MAAKAPGTGIWRTGSPEISHPRIGFFETAAGEISELNKTASASLIAGRITEDQPPGRVSQMAGHGVIFSDGIENDFLALNPGTSATITLAEKRRRLVV